MAKKILATLLAATVLSGCSLVEPVPFTEAEHETRVRGDLQTIFADQEQVTQSIDLETAIARALTYNLDHRLKLMEQAVALSQLDVANLELLPDITANAGYNLRSNKDSTFNESKTSTSTSSDKYNGTGDLTAAWSLLDFGIGYYRAKQSADLANIVVERRRQVVQNIVEDTRRAYWNQVASERAIAALAEVDRQADELLKLADQNIADGLDKRAALIQKRDMLAIKEQIVQTRRVFASAKVELRALMNLDPGFDFVTADAALPRATDLLTVKIDTEDLELAALRNRTELRSEAYQLRVTQQEAKIAVLEMIPGLSFSAGINTTTDSFKPNQRWYDASVNLTWNLMNILRSPTRMRAIRDEEHLSQVRRLALSMAVISQVNVAKINFTGSAETFEIQNELVNAQNDLLAELEAANGDGVSELDVISQRVQMLNTQFRADLAYADMQYNFGRIFAAVGADPLPDTVDDGSIDALAAALRQTIGGWEEGRIKMQKRTLEDAKVTIGTNGPVL